MILANRAVILCKIGEFKWAIQDLNFSIQTEQYPSENQYKLYQRLAKAHEHLEDYDSASENYKKLIESIELAKIPKNQKLQFKTDAEKCIGLGKKRIIAKNFITFESNEMQASPSDDFPTYKAPHPQIPNASGL